MELFKTERDRQGLKYKGHNYYKDGKETKNHIRWKCQLYFTKKNVECKGALKTDLQLTKVLEEVEHNH